MKIRELQAKLQSLPSAVVQLRSDEWNDDSEIVVETEDGPREVTGVFIRDTRVVLVVKS